MSYDLPRFTKVSLAREMLKLNSHEYPKDPMEAGIKNDIWYSAYQNLRNRIIEKIEHLQSQIKGDHFEDCDCGHDYETHQNIEFALYELRSILEDEK